MSLIVPPARIGAYPCFTSGAVTGSGVRLPSPRNPNAFSTWCPTRRLLARGALLPVRLVSISWRATAPLSRAISRPCAVDRSTSPLNGGQRQPSARRPATTNASNSSGSAVQPVEVPAQHRTDGAVADVGQHRLVGGPALDPRGAGVVVHVLDRGPALRSAHTASRNPGAGGRWRRRRRCGRGTAAQVDGGACRLRWWGRHEIECTPSSR